MKIKGVDTSHYDYSTVTVECELIEFAVHYSAPIFNALKYILRAPYKKSEEQDYKKALSYLEVEKKYFKGDTPHLELTLMVEQYKKLNPIVNALFYSSGEYTRKTIDDAIELIINQLNIIQRRGAKDDS